MLIKMDNKFMEMVDELVCMADQEEELFDGIKWIDRESKKLQISFYEMFFIVLQKHLSEERAKEWMKTK